MSKNKGIMLLVVVAVSALLLFVWKNCEGKTGDGLSKKNSRKNAIHDRFRLWN